MHTINNTKSSIFYIKRLTAGHSTMKDNLAGQMEAQLPKYQVVREHDVFFGQKGIA